MDNGFRRWLRLLESADSSFLAGIAQADQAARKDYAAFVAANGGDWQKGATLYAQKHNRPVDDIFGEKARMDQFIAHARTFDFKTFAEADWNNFWIVSQHCDFDRRFQKWALGVIKQYEGEDNPHFKYLYDRISCGLTGRQKFGTQDGCACDKTRL